MNIRIVKGVKYFALVYLFFAVVSIAIIAHAQLPCAGTCEGHTLPALGDSVAKGSLWPYYMFFYRH